MKTEYGPTMVGLTDDEMGSADELYKAVKNPLSPHTSPKRVVKVKPLVEDILSSENELDYVDCDPDSEDTGKPETKVADVEPVLKSSSGSSSSDTDSSSSSDSDSDTSSSESSSASSKSRSSVRRLKKRVKVRHSITSSESEAESNSSKKSKKSETGNGTAKDRGTVLTEGEVTTLPSVTVGKVVAVNQLKPQETVVSERLDGTYSDNMQGNSEVAEVPSIDVVPLVTLLQQTQNERIILNIGGQRFETSRLTLSRYPNSVLAQLVASNGVTPRYGNTYFVDRDPSHFRLILNYMKNGLCDLRTLPRDVRYLYELYYEAQFYQLQDLMRAVIEKIEQVSVFPANLPFTAHKVGI
jgi:hypothetical protein